MRRKTPTAPEREGGEIVRSGSDGPTPCSSKPQPSEWLRVPAGKPPAIHRAQLLETADRYDRISGFEASAAMYRRHADLIRRGRFIQARPR